MGKRNEISNLKKEQIVLIKSKQGHKIYRFLIANILIKINICIFFKVFSYHSNQKGRGRGVGIRY